MGFVTNQWLRGIVERNKSYRPMEVSINPLNTSDSWSNNKKVFGGIRATIPRD